MPGSGSGGYTTRVPSGKVWRRKPSPSCTSRGGVRSSTSRTNPGLGMSVGSPLILLGRERHLERAERAGAERVVQRPAPAGERTGGAPEVLEQRGLRRKLHRGVERAP